MFNLDLLETLFVITAFVFQIILIIHFWLRKTKFAVAVRYGPIVYALSIPAACISIALLVGGKPWTLWLAGFLYLAWAVLGYTVEYLLKITDWREKFTWTIFIPYIGLYLATVMFYWWPLASLYKPLWYVYTVLFIICTYLNVTSHKGE